MRMNRRNVLVGLGTIVAGGGAALGSGAFTSVDANRDITINTDADDGALLQIVGNSNYGGNVSEYVNNGTSGGTSNTTAISIGEGDTTGVNENATTTFSALLEVTNNGTQSAEFYIDDSSSSISDSPLDFKSGETSVVGSGSSMTLNTGSSSSITISVIVDLTSGSEGDIPEDVTFVAGTN